jgi:hypothetical protein
VIIAVMSIALIIAAIAIPNLMKSKEKEGNMDQDGHGVNGPSVVRTLIFCQISYSNSFPETGYASDLASLGSGPHGKCGNGPSKSHACLLDNVLGCDSGASGGWCIKHGYRFATTAVCKQGLCDDFVIVGTPVDPSKGKRNFCATSDGVPRGRSEPPLTSPITVSECQSWKPL